MEATMRHQILLRLIVYFWATNFATAEWENWGGWTKCSKTCGSGITWRRRTCDGICDGQDDEQILVCNSDLCPELPCGGDIYVGNEPGNIATPRYPLSYPAEKNCTWNFDTDEGYKMVFTTQGFQLQESPTCKSDYLLALDPFLNSENKYCGRSFRGQFESTQNKFKLQFVSDLSFQDKGFLITYKRKLIPNCPDGFCLNGGICNGNYSCECLFPYAGYKCSYKMFDVDGEVFNQPKPVFTQHKTAKTATCSLFGMDHIRTFDRRFGTFTGSCLYKMFGRKSITTNLAISVYVRRKDNCVSSSTSCNHLVKIKVGANQVEIFDDGKAKLDYNEIDIPFNDMSFRVSESSWRVVYVKVEHVKLAISLDTFSVLLSVPDDYKSDTEGLCGDYNGDPDDDVVNGDFVALANKWVQKEEGRTCSYSNKLAKCPEKEEREATMQTVLENKVCNVLLSEAFNNSRFHIDHTEYYQACMLDACRCDLMKRDNCHCSAVAAYAAESTWNQYKVEDWRTVTSCAPKCPENQVFSECAPCYVKTCKNQISEDCNTPCREGCKCPGDDFWDEENSWCVSREKCPCYADDVVFKPSEKRKEDCNTCTCKSGGWHCTDNECPAIAMANGFSHYFSFDGKNFDFPAANCPLVFTYDCTSRHNFEIWLHTKPCGEGAKFACLEQVEVVINAVSHYPLLTLFDGGDMILNSGMPTKTLPLYTSGISVHRLSSEYIMVTILYNGISIIWDRHQTIMTTAPASMKGKICGLAGRYNGKSDDDFTSREGVIEAAKPFAESWGYDYKCLGSTTVKACEANYVADAEKYCRGICEDPVFALCKGKVICDTYYENCKQDVCACDSTSDCKCAAVAAYALACSHYGIYANWRKEGFCEISCPANQLYQVATTSCGKTCRSQMEPGHCDPSVLVEGCNCVEGEFLSKDGQTCVPLNQCYCFHNGEWIAPGQVVHSTVSDICFCIGGKVTCPGHEKFDSENVTLTCDGNLIAKNCGVLDPGDVGAACLRTCQNRLESTCPSRECQSGCICPEGLVYHDGSCRDPKECPCFLRGSQYSIGTIKRDGCSKINCTSEGWRTVSEVNCYTRCDFTAGSFYTTFDDRHYQFLGACEYTLATDQCSLSTDSYKFWIKAQSSYCPGSNTAMCGTTIHAMFGAYAVSFETGRPVIIERLFWRSNTEDHEVIVVKKFIKGSYTIIVADLSNEQKITIIWDRNMRIYIKFSEEMKKLQTCGMCGDNDGESMNDFRVFTKETVTSASKLANAWKVNLLCADETTDRVPDCGHKLSWAQEKCNILLDKEFSVCHYTVDPWIYYKKCVTATCSCDSGGDCECFCDAIADYVFACSNLDVFIEWRKPDLCPAMCESYNEKDGECLWKYRTCGLHIKTCEPNPFIDGCYEGCYPTCPNEKFYDKENNSCIFEDECPTPPSCPDKSKEHCLWLPWKNFLKEPLIYGGDFEEIRKYKESGFCNLQYDTVKDIKCRKANDISNRAQNSVLCDKRYGLACFNEYQGVDSFCDDYEIRIECCSCCLNETCPLRPSCEENEQLVTINTTQCCVYYECQCDSCPYGDEKWDVGYTEYDDCDQLKCVREDGKCKVESSSIKCPGPARTCHSECTKVSYSNYTEDGIPAGCCLQSSCTCTDECAPTSDGTCPVPKVLNETVDGINCCFCPSPEESYNSTCVKQANCTQDGCHNHDISECGCIQNSTCVCRENNCPPDPNCEVCEKMQVTQVNSSVEASLLCQTDNCCPKKSCKKFCMENETSQFFEIGKSWTVEDEFDCEVVHYVCKLNSSGGCPVKQIEKRVYNNSHCEESECVSYYRSQLNKSDCCNTCVCDPTLCPTNETECKWPKELQRDSAESNECCQVMKCSHPCEKVKCELPPECTLDIKFDKWTEDGCCEKYKCVVPVCEDWVDGVSPKDCCDGQNCSCLEKYQAIEDKNCTAPEILKSTIIFNETLNFTCARLECVCPEMKLDERSRGCIGSRSCQSAGCTTQDEVKCENCIVDSRCVCKPGDCPAKPVCEECESWVLTTEAGVASSNDTRCEDNTCCERYQCRRIECNVTSNNVSCEDWELKADVSTDPCCSNFTCVCDQTRANCPTTTCDIGFILIEDVSTECCPTTRCECDFTNCTVDECGDHEKEVINEVSPCCNKTSCECDNTTCPKKPNCTDSEILAENKELADGCCTVEICKPRYCTAYDNQYENGDEWVYPDDECWTHWCQCNDTECQIVKSPTANCLLTEQPKCVNGHDPVERTDSEEPCCVTWECACECLIHGVDHYKTFDGAQYTFRGECGYTLVEFKDSEDLQIISDNTDCKFDVESVENKCHKVINVIWRGTTVVLDQTTNTSIAQSIKVNNSYVSFPWHRNGLRIDVNTAHIHVTIEEAGLVLFYTIDAEGTPFVKITVSPRTVHNNTYGLCGSCSNDRNDDFLIENGSVVSSKIDFGYSWEQQVGGEACPTPCTDGEPSCRDCSDFEEDALPEACRCPNDTCGVFNSTKYEECDEVVNVTEYISKCEHDATVYGKCYPGTQSIETAFTLECQLSENDQATCVQTNQTVNCFGDLQYKECTKTCLLEATCQNRNQDCDESVLTSGCACPEGQVAVKAGAIECKKPECCECANDPICEDGKELVVKEGQEESLCCPEKTCQCPNQPDLECEEPYVVLFTDEECPTKYCGCPNISTDACEFDRKTCTDSNGCTSEHVDTDKCGCPIKEPECICNKALCPGEPECQKCMVVAVNNTVDTRGACGSCCEQYYCKSKECEIGQSDAIIPREGEKLVTVDDEGCCFTSECDVCWRIIDYTLVQVKRGESFNESDVNGCEVEYICTSDRLGTGCFKSKINSDPRGRCSSREEYKKSCNKNEIVIKVNSTDPCCENYTCECAPESFLETVCEHWGRNASGPCKTLIKMQDYNCCPQYEEVDHEPPKGYKPPPTCAEDGSELVTTEEDECFPVKKCQCITNATRLKEECDKHVKNCSYWQSSESVEILEGHCCQQQVCVCDDCPNDYNNTKPVPTASYLKVVEQSEKENEKQLCCPEWKIVCNDNRDHCENITNCPTNQVMQPPNVDNNCCPSCVCLSPDKLNCPENDVKCDIGEIVMTHNSTIDCCENKSCECGCPEGYRYRPQQYPDEQSLPAYKQFQNDSENLLQKCCPKEVVVCRESGCSKPTCNASFSVVEISGRKDPDTDYCCPLWQCKCDVCLLDNGQTKAVGEVWTEMEDGCNVTKECIEEREKKICDDGFCSIDVTSCHKVKITDPRNSCMSQTQYEQENCLLNAIAVNSTSVQPSCCSEFQCECRKDYLLCPTNSLSCPEYTEKVSTGPSHETPCCPTYECVCKPDSLLKIECDTWYDYNCTLGYKTEEVRPRNESALECCPEYKCVCEKCVQGGVVYPVNHSWTDDADVCKGYQCNNTDGVCPEVVPFDKFSCEPVDEDNCRSNGGTIEDDPDTLCCCKHCVLPEPTCKVTVDNMVLNVTVDGIQCWTSKINVTRCVGTCLGTRTVDQDTGEPTGYCQCCTPNFVGTLIEVKCDDNEEREYMQKAIDDCMCLDTVCPDDKSRIDEVSALSPP
ncbi:unnamed protein product [Clavelina lepadiformis]|uniref:SCO-spondin n=1 Tax=Clavelina lepadiformis TaxID=159417 RepID=A0ABP0FHW3_CLALP